MGGKNAGQKQNVEMSQKKKKKKKKKGGNPREKVRGREYGMIAQSLVFGRNVHYAECRV